MKAARQACIDKGWVKGIRYYSENSCHRNKSLGEKIYWQGSWKLLTEVFKDRGSYYTFTITKEGLKQL